MKDNFCRPLDCLLDCHNHYSLTCVELYTPDLIHKRVVQHSDHLIQIGIGSLNFRDMIQY